LLVRFADYSPAPLACRWRGAGILEPSTSQHLCLPLGFRLVSAGATDPRPLGFLWVSDRASRVTLPRAARAAWLDRLVDFHGLSESDCCFEETVTMTMHETLRFLDALHGHLERSVSNPGPWCWPTRELVARNLRLNRKAFPRDTSPKDSFNRQLSIALRRHWIAAGPCQPHCHAQHLTLTAGGQEALALMNEQGCGPQCHVHREMKLHLERKVA